MEVMKKILLATVITALYVGCAIVCISLVESSFKDCVNFTAESVSFFKFFIVIFTIVLGIRIFLYTFTEALNIKVIALLSLKFFIDVISPSGLYCLHFLTHGPELNYLRCIFGTLLFLNLAFIFMAVLFNFLGDFTPRGFLCLTISEYVDELEAYNLKVSELDTIISNELKESKF